MSALRDRLAARRDAESLGDSSREYVTLKAAALAIGAKQETLRKAIDSGVLPAERIGTRRDGRAFRWRVRMDHVLLFGLMGRRHRGDAMREYAPAVGFGTLLRQMRKARGMSQKTLAEMVGSDGGRISRYELGTGNIPTVWMIHAMAEALAVSPHDRLRLYDLAAEMGNRHDTRMRGKQ